MNREQFIKTLMKTTYWKDYIKEVDNIVNLENKHCDDLVLKLIDDISEIVGCNVRDYEVNVVFKGVISNYILQEEPTEYKLIHPYGLSLCGSGDMEYFKNKEVFELVIKHNKLMEEARKDSQSARDIIYNKYYNFIN